MMLKWKRVGESITAKVGWRTIVTKRFILPDGSEHDFQIVNAEGTHNAGVIALTPDKRVVTARMFRAGPEKIMDEIPGGEVKPSETDFQAAALRELKEETGYIAGKVTPLGFVYKDAYNNSQWHYFLAEDCRPSAQGAHRDEHEFIEVQLISIEQLLENARTGRMTDACAVALAYDKLTALKEKRA